jgi:hypothetical protein
MSRGSNRSFIWVSVMWETGDAFPVISPTVTAVFFTVSYYYEAENMNPPPFASCHGYSWCNGSQEGSEQRDDRPGEGSWQEGGKHEPKSNVRLQVLTAVTIKITDFRDVTQCKAVDRDQYFGGTCCLHFQSKWVFTLKMAHPASYQMGTGAHPVLVVCRLPVRRLAESSLFVVSCRQFMKNTVELGYNVIKGT